MELWVKLTAFAAIGQLVIFGLGAIFAYLQLRGLRKQQEAQLIQAVFERLNSDELANAFDFVYNDLAKRLTEPSYVREISEGRYTASTHRELAVMHFFNALGLLVHEGMVDEFPIVPMVASPCMRSWIQIAPVIELIRRRDPHAYTPFEALVARSRAVDLSKINGRFQSETPGLKRQWESTARDLIDKRIRLLDEAATQPDGTLETRGAG
jgi:hypothetical protein